MYGADLTHSAAWSSPSLFDVQNIILLTYDQKNKTEVLSSMSIVFEILKHL